MFLKTHDTLLLNKNNDLYHPLFKTELCWEAYKVIWNIQGD